jgi:hypothetical protein
MAKEYKKRLQERLNIKNINAVPHVDSVIVSLGI